MPGFLLNFMFINNFFLVLALKYPIRRVAKTDRNETKLTYNRGFRWIAGIITNNSIRRPRREIRA